VLRQFTESFEVTLSLQVHNKASRLRRLEAERVSVRCTVLQRMEGHLWYLIPNFEAPSAAAMDEMAYVVCTPSIDHCILKICKRVDGARRRRGEECRGSPAAGSF
jgi:hypothetical protein